MKARPTIPVDFAVRPGANPLLLSSWTVPLTDSDPDIGRADPPVLIQEDMDHQQSGIVWVAGTDLFGGMVDVGRLPRLSGQRPPDGWDPLGRPWAYVNFGYLTEQGQRRQLAHRAIMAALVRPHQGATYRRTLGGHATIIDAWRRQSNPGAASLFQATTHQLISGADRPAFKTLEPALRPVGYDSNHTLARLSPESWGPSLAREQPLPSVGRPLELRRIQTLDVTRTPQPSTGPGSPLSPKGLRAWLPAPAAYSGPATWIRPAMPAVCYGSAGLPTRVDLGSTTIAAPRQSRPEVSPPVPPGTQNKDSGSRYMTCCQAS
jgi:hypothetical protein